MSGFILMET